MHLKFKHGFWAAAGILLLIIGLGGETLAGNLMGVPTILSLTPFWASTPNVLQQTQIVLTVLGIIFLFIGLA